MQMTVETVVILVAILIVALIFIGVVTNWGKSGGNLISDFFSEITGAKQQSSQTKTAPTGGGFSRTGPIQLPV